MTERYTDEWEDFIKDNLTKEEFRCNSYTKPDIITRLNKLWHQTQRFAKHNKELEKENEQLKKDIEYYRTERRAVFEYMDKKDDLHLELKCDKND